MRSTTLSPARTVVLVQLGWAQGAREHVLGDGVHAVSEAAGVGGRGPVAGEDVVGVTAHDEGVGGEELVVGDLGGVVAAVVEGPQLGMLDDAVEGDVGGVGDVPHYLFSVRSAEEFGEGCGHDGVVDVVRLAVEGLLARAGDAVRDLDGCWG